MNPADYANIATPQELLEAAYARGECDDPAGRFCQLGSPWEPEDFELKTQAPGSPPLYFRVPKGLAAPCDFPATRDLAMAWVRMRRRREWEELVREGLALLRPCGFSPEVPILWGPRVYSGRGCGVRWREVGGVRRVQADWGHRASVQVTLCGTVIPSSIPGGIFPLASRDIAPLQRLFQLGMPLIYAGPTVAVVSLGRRSPERPPTT